MKAKHESLYMLVISGLLIFMHIHTTECRRPGQKSGGKPSKFKGRSFMEATTSIPEESTILDEDYLETTTEDNYKKGRSFGDAQPSSSSSKESNTKTLAWSTSDSSEEKSSASASKEETTSKSLTWSASDSSEDTSSSSKEATADENSESNLDNGPTSSPLSSEKTTLKTKRKKSKSRKQKTKSKSNKKSSKNKTKKRKKPNSRSRKRKTTTEKSFSKKLKDGFKIQFG